MRLQTKMVVHSVLEALLATKVTLSHLNRYMTKQELDLFKLASGLMAKPSTCSAQIMGRDNTDIAA